MRRIRCFLLTATKQGRRSLRRFVFSDKGKCSGPAGYHTASVVIDDAIPLKPEAIEKGYVGYGERGPRPFEGDARWPTTCPCGYLFTAEDEWQVNVDVLFSGAPEGGICTLRDAPAGAMWDALWWPKKGPDGRALYVRLPNGRDWHIDGRASNCTRRDDNVHQCWVRHGEPPDVTVGKDGDTCAAGAGSILAGDYHGFLRGGYLED